MERIATQAGVSKRTLYKYFPVKEALLECLLEAELAADLEMRDFSRHEQAGFRSGTVALLRESARWCGQHVDVLLPYIRYKFASFDPGALPQRDSGLLPLWIMLIEAAQARGELAQGRDPAQLGMYFHFLYLGALMRWLTQPQLVDLEDEFETVVTLFIHGAAGERD